MPRATLAPPVLINNAPVKQHVRLLAVDDLNLQNISEELAEQKRVAKEAAEAEAAAPARKRPRT